MATPNATATPMASFSNPKPLTKMPFNSTQRQTPSTPANNAEYHNVSAPKATLGPGIQHQTPMTVCTSCGVDWFSDQKMRREFKVMQIQLQIVNDLLYRAGMSRQQVELSLKDANARLEQYGQSVAATENTNSQLREELRSQQQALEKLRVEHGLAAKSLEHEFDCHAKTEASLARETAIATKLIEFLNKIDLGRQDILGSSFGNIGMGDFVKEWASNEEEVRYLKSELKRKHQIMEAFSYGSTEEDAEGEDEDSEVHSPSNKRKREL